MQAKTRDGRASKIIVWSITVLIGLLQLTTVILFARGVSPHGGPYIIAIAAVEVMLAILLVAFFRTRSLPLRIIAPLVMVGAHSAMAMLILYSYV
jgi:hypothetical protein